ncbi:unnamed protein product [Ilex paraguariensis]|uniref:Proton pump-interactor 1 n=1 Tax=Ilex paraguariensis TaxID=185542 RepID=A0ABC8UPK5_9AQUA
MGVEVVKSEVASVSVEDGIEENMSLLHEIGEVVKSNVAPVSVEDEIEENMSLLHEIKSEVASVSVEDEIEENMSLLHEMDVGVVKSEVALVSMENGVEENISLLHEMDVEIEKSEVAPVSVEDGDKENISLMHEKGVEVIKSEATPVYVENGVEENISLLHEKGVEVIKSEATPVYVENGFEENISLGVEVIKSEVTSISVEDEIEENISLLHEMGVEVIKSEVAPVSLEVGVKENISLGVEVVKSEVASVSVEDGIEENISFLHEMGVEVIKSEVALVSVEDGVEENISLGVEVVKSEVAHVSIENEIKENISLLHEMGVEIVKSEVTPVYVEDGIKENMSLLHEKPEGKLSHGRLNNPIQLGSYHMDDPEKSCSCCMDEPIQFGSYCKDEPVKEEQENIPQANFPKDAVDQWHGPKQIHKFYLVKYRSYNDQKLNARLDQADKELQTNNQARYQIIEKLRAKRADRAQMVGQLKSLNVENEQFRMIMDEKRKQMEPPQQALDKFRGSKTVGRESGVCICSSEEELDDLIKSLEYCIKHESITLNEEKQILREIKQLEGTRERVASNAAMRAKNQDSLGGKETIQVQAKLIGVDSGAVRKEHQVVKAKIKQLRHEKEAIEKQINSLEEELKIVTQKRCHTFENIQQLRKQRKEGNACFYQNRLFLIKSRELAAKKDCEALTELSSTEVEKFMSQWNSSKAFRGDYEKKILQSLDIRQFSNDARRRNPDEKPLLLPEALSSSETETLAKNKAKQPKEDSISPPQHTTPPNPEVQKEKNNKHHQEANTKPMKSTWEQSELEGNERISESEKQQKDPPKGNEVDEAKLKEMKREEEMAKAKQALERKKKLAEKAANKAAIKAQKEAEKKLKEIII